MSAATAAFHRSGRRVRATVAPPAIVNRACDWRRSLIKLRTLVPATLASVTGHFQTLSTAGKLSDSQLNFSCNRTGGTICSLPACRPVGIGGAQPKRTHIAPVGDGWLSAFVPKSESCGPPASSNADIPQNCRLSVSITDWLVTRCWAFRTPHPLLASGPIWLPKHAESLMLKFADRA